MVLDKINLGMSTCLYKKILKENKALDVAQHSADPAHLSVRHQLKDKRGHCRQYSILILKLFF